MRGWMKSLATVLGPLAALIGVIAFFALIDLALHGEAAIFWSKQNLQSISVQNAFVAICALGMLLVIISGGIDLSAGAAPARRAGAIDGPAAKVRAVTTSSRTAKRSSGQNSIPR